MENETTTSSAGKAMGIAALVLGIVAFIFSFVPCLGTYAIIPGVVGLILGVIGYMQANKAGAKKGLAIAGLVLSLLGSVVAVYQYTQLEKAAGALKDFGVEMQKSLDSIKQANEIPADTTATPHE